MPMPRLAAKKTAMIVQSSGVRSMGRRSGRRAVTPARWAYPDFFGRESECHTGGTAAGYSRVMELNTLLDRAAEFSGNGKVKAAQAVLQTYDRLRKDGFPSRPPAICATSGWSVRSGRVRSRYTGKQAFSRTCDSAAVRRTSEGSDRCNGSGSGPVKSLRVCARVRAVSRSPTWPAQPIVVVRFRRSK